MKALRTTLLFLLAAVLLLPAACGPDPETTIFLPEKEYISISTQEDLQAIGADSASLSGIYRLEADIVLAGEWEPIGTREAPFTGELDGNGHTVSGLTISDPDAYYRGLFGYAYAATITDLILTDVHLEGGSTGQEAGALAAVAIDCTIAGCREE